MLSGSKYVMGEGMVDLSWEKSSEAIVMGVEGV